MDNAIIKSSSTASASGFVTQVELAVKWTDIMGADYVPSAGDQYKSAVLMCDNDGGIRRDTFLMDVGAHKNVMTRPGTWHVVTLND